MLVLLVRKDLRNTSTPVYDTCVSLLRRAQNEPHTSKLLCLCPVFGGPGPFSFLFFLCYLTNSWPSFLAVLRRESLRFHLTVKRVHRRVILKGLNLERKLGSSSRKCTYFRDIASCIAIVCGDYRGFFLNHFKACRCVEKWFYF